MIWPQGMYKKLLKYAGRRDYLARHAIGCPSCTSSQVQLIMHDSVPAVWRCRKCRHKFYYEPSDQVETDDA